MLNVLSLFSGIGAFEKALERLDIEHQVVAYCKIDKYASKSYSLIHGISEDMNLKDVTKIDFLDVAERVDLITYGFPCQDISLAGHGKGFRDDEGNLTRSGLFFEAARIIDDYRPKFAIAENVKALTMKRHKDDFETVLETLENIGYINYYAVLNAKDFGIPQNRERVFIVSIRKDIEKGFEFPKGFELKKRLKDVLESNVDESYYLSDDRISKILAWKAHQKPFERVLGSNSISPTLTARGAGENHSGMILLNEESDNTSNMQEFLIIKEATKKGYAEANEGNSVNLEHPKSKTRRGRVGKQVAQTLTTSCNQGVVEPRVINPLKDKTKNGWHFEQQVYDENGITRTIKANGGSGNIPKVIEPVICASRGRNPQNPSSRKAGDPTEQRIKINKNGVSNTLTTVQKDNYVIEPTLRIRKLTPKECWRLMGFDDEDFEKAAKKISNTQLYKQAGNSIVVNVLEAIFKELGKVYDEFKNF